MTSPQPYKVIATKIETASETFTSNRDANLEAIGKVEEVLEKARLGGGEKHNQRHLDRGKILPRQRVELLLDRDSHFLELCPIAGHTMKTHPGGGLIAGIGVISGVECMITANDCTVKGGAVNEAGMQKSRRVADIAAQNRLPGISMIESAGADLPNQSKIFVPGGRGFRDITRASKSQHPSICVVFGSCTAGGAYIPGMSDYTIMVKEQSQVYLAGPPLVKMATGEEVDHESLGGAEMHSRISGVSDYLAEDETEAIRMARELVSHLNWTKNTRPELRGFDEPVYDEEELLGVASSDVRIPFDAREVIARVVDGSRFSEFKPLYGDTLVCGWANVHGYPVGIIANNGILFSEAANKGAQFIQLCNQTDTPLLFLQNITGFMVGKKYEQEGIIKNGAKLINAVSNSTVPAITIMIGASYGAGNYAMCGRAYEPRFLFSWPNHRIAVMGGKQLAGVLDIIKRDSAARKGEEVNEKGLETMKMIIEAQIVKESDPLFASGHLWDDGIIDPRDTRSVLAICLSSIHSGTVQGTSSWGVFRH